MHADERTRTVIHHEWTLPTPAHHTEVAKALAVAHQKRDTEPGHPGDIEFTHGDDQIVIGYSVERHPDLVAGVADQILRADRDEWRRRAEITMATAERVRQLATAWSASASADYRVAGGELHETLDGPGDEPAAQGRDLPPDSITYLSHAARIEVIRERHHAMAYSGPTAADRERDTVISHLLGMVADQAERLSLARQALARDGYFAGHEIGEDVAPRITELLVHLRGRAGSAEAAVARARGLATSWAEHRYVGLGGESVGEQLIRALGDQSGGEPE